MKEFGQDRQKMLRCCCETDRRETAEAALLPGFGGGRTDKGIAAVSTSCTKSRFSGCGTAESKLLGGVWMTGQTEMVQDWQQMFDASNLDIVHNFY